MQRMGFNGVSYGVGKHRILREEGLFGVLDEHPHT